MGRIHAGKLMSTIELVKKLLNQDRHAHEIEDLEDFRRKPMGADIRLTDEQCAAMDEMSEYSIPKK